MMLQNKRRTITNAILIGLEKTVDGVVRLSDFANNPGYYVYYNGWDYPLKKSYLSKALKRLKENGLIDFIEDGEITLKLTDQGKERAMLAKMLVENEKWDGRWRIIIFDIPEKRKVVRELLRYKLKSWGFQKWQQSVWVTKKDCVEPLKKFIQQVGIKDWVKVFEAKNIDL